MVRDDFCSDNLLIPRLFWRGEGGRGEGLLDEYRVSKVSKIETCTLANFTIFRCVTSLPYLVLVFKSFLYCCVCFAMHVFLFNSGV